MVSLRTAEMMVLTTYRLLKSEWLKTAQISGKHPCHMGLCLMPAKYLPIALELGEGCTYNSPLYVASMPESSIA